MNGDPAKYRERLAEFVADQGIALEYSDEIAAGGISLGVMEHLETRARIVVESNGQ